MSEPALAPLGSDEWLEFWSAPGRLEALSHPLRVRAYIEAVKCPVSAKELSDQMGVPLQRMSYHVRSLADSGLLTVVRRTPRRGAVETHYRAVASLEFDSTNLPPELFRTWYRIVVGLIAEDANHAIDAGAGERPDYLMGRLHFALDEEGRRRLKEEILDFYDRLAALAGELTVLPEDGGREVNLAFISYEGEREGGRNGPMYISLGREDDRPTVPRD